MAKTLFQDKVPHPFNDSHLSQSKPIVVIGTSTGGPRALQYVLGSLPSEFPAPVLIVQHMPAGFTNSLAHRLNMAAPMRVKEAEHGEILENGTAYITPGNYHLRLKAAGKTLLVDLNQTDRVNGHRPSVDVLMESVARLTDYQPVAVIMTGMGTDGWKGIEKLKQANRHAYVIAEARESCVVYGMPKAVVSRRLHNAMVSVDAIGKTILDVIRV
ncbi:two-component system, chemotaxis family, response regulator CheB [Thalassobacillus cyri]|uniref:protein-glutamate methylesterase n=1 Tax=Thalassobacillus cyri TaxID=571932 RepID=A0A1H4G0X4_9BACI|nr:CheB methylesterase domain-containing protein [Thalassobacillus cyri]SEB02991.1 two-component system, chemotaxis family, response regulator CheB [Thalassobacillus cyri]